MTDSPAATAVPSSPPPPPPKLGFLSNNPSRTGFDPAQSFWRNYFRFCTRRMTPEGQFHFREHEYAVNETFDCARCETMRDSALARSPTVRFMADKIAGLGGRLDASNIHCQRCPARLDEEGNIHRQGGGFSPAHGILLCANEIRDGKHLEDTLAHEMVHAWDFLRWKMDFTGKNSLRHAACTEIRASMLSGECRWWRWGKEARARGDWTIAAQFQNCVRERAVMSMMARPKIKDTEHAAKVVNSVWDSCFADTRPFDEVYR